MSILRRRDAHGEKNGEEGREETDQDEPDKKADPPKRVAAPSLAALGKAEIKKIQGLLKSKTADGVTLRLSLLESLGAMRADVGEGRRLREAEHPGIRREPCHDRVRDVAKAAQRQWMLVLREQFSGLGSSRTRWFPWSPLFLNPHIAWYMKSNPVSAQTGILQAYQVGMIRLGRRPDQREWFAEATVRMNLLVVVRLLALPGSPGREIGIF